MNQSIIDYLTDQWHPKKPQVDAWLNELMQRSPPFFYYSLDIRHADFKLAPVDTNLFPGGFNNLNAEQRRQAVHASTQYLKQYHPSAQRVLLVAEDHTRNQFYLENIATLYTMLEQTGYEVCITSLSSCANQTSLQLDTPSGAQLNFTPFENKNRQLISSTGWQADLVIVNNDLTHGTSELISDLACAVMPPPGFGWYKRRKTAHFDSYDQLARQFAQIIDIDPWLISTHFSQCGVIDFKQRKGVECVARQVDKVLYRIEQKYQYYNIDQTPYVFIKSDKGTYGMGIMTAKSGEEILSMDRSIRKKMSTIKGGIPNSEVIIQEGVPTVDMVDDYPAEPMIYMIGGTPVGHFYRLNRRKDAFGNLNASGMDFAPWEQNEHKKPLLDIMAKIAACAAARECYELQYTI